MDEKKVTRVITEESVQQPAQTVVTEQVVAATPETDEAEFALFKFDQLAWFIIGLICLLLVSRFVLLLLGANNVGFVSFIYDFSGVFVLPFRGIFESPSYGSSFFDTASLVGIFVYIVIGFIISSLLRLFSKRA